MKRTLLAVIVLALAAPQLAADDDCPALRQLGALYELRNVVLHRGTYDVNSWIDRRVDTLRDPVPGGYRWVRWVRPGGGDDPVDKHLHMTRAVQGSGSDSFEASGTHAYAVRVVVPAKKSLFSRNNAVYVGTVRVSYEVDGRTRTKQEAINQWMNPDTSRSIDLGTIADRVEASLDASTAQKNVNEALVEIHFREAVMEDDPANPSYDAIRSLRRIRDASDTPYTLDDEIARVEHGVFGTESLPLLSIVRDLRHADELMRSKKSEDQEKGDKLLKDTMRRLRD